MDDEARKNHQDNLIHARLQWFAVSQSFLFTAYAISQGLDNDSKNVLGVMLPLLGALSGFTVFLSLWLGVRSYRKYRELTPTPYQTKYAWLWAGFAPVILPVFFVAAWIIIVSTREPPAPSPRAPILPTPSPSAVIFSRAMTANPLRKSR